MRSRPNLGDEILELRRRGVAVRQIAEELKCSKGNVSYHINKAGLGGAVALRREQEASEVPADRLHLLDWLIQAGVSRKDAADALTLDYPAVLRRAKELNSARQAAVSSYAAVKRRRLHLKMLGVARLGGKCSKCAYKGCLQALAFHHVDPTAKGFTISQVTSIAWERMKCEVDKCVLLCANCHQEVHSDKSEPDLP